jgi:hypothetical protein
MRCDLLDDLILSGAKTDRHLGRESIKIEQQTRILIRNRWPRQPNLFPIRVSLRPEGGPPSIIHTVESLIPFSAPNSKSFVIALSKAGVEVTIELVVDLPPDHSGMLPIVTR